MSLDRVFAARVAGDVAVAGASEPVPGGVRLHCAALPQVGDLNAVLLGPGSTDGDLAAAVAGDARRVSVFRDVAVPDGWRGLRLVVMTAPSPPPDMPAGIEDARGARTDDPIWDAFVAAGARTLGIRSDGEWAGWAMVIEGCIDDVYVDERRRGRGLGRMLTQAAQAAGGWFLWCLEDDPVPQHLYRSLGFTQVGTAVQLSRLPG